MLHFFKEIINESVVTHLKSKGYTQKKYQASNVLEEDNVYFSKIEGDLNFNIYINLGSGDRNTPELLDYTINYGVYSTQFNTIRNYPISEQPSGTSNTVYWGLDDLFGEANYWQTLSTATKKEAATTHFLDILQKILDVFAPINSWESLVDVCLKTGPWFHSNFEHFVPYFKITDNPKRLEEMIAAIRNQLKQNTGALEYFEADLPRLLDTNVLKQKVANNFTKGMKVPKSWEKVLDWTEKNPHTVIGGHFEICDNSNNLLQHIVDINGNAAKKLAILGTNSADEVFCIWQKDKKTMPIVFLGEAGRAKVIAESIDDFIQLLAVGYYEVEIADYNTAPVFPEGAAHWANPKFQAFYTKNFKKEIPKTGAEIVARNATTNQDFFGWIGENDALWAAWKS